MAGLCRAVVGSACLGSLDGVQGLQVWPRQCTDALCVVGGEYGPAPGVCSLWVQLIELWLTDITRCMTVEGKFCLCVIKGCSFVADRGVLNRPEDEVAAGRPDARQRRRDLWRRCLQCRGINFLQPGVSGVFSPVIAWFGGMGRVEWAYHLRCHQACLGCLSPIESEMVMNRAVVVAAGLLPA